MQVSGRVSRSLLRDLIEEQDFHFTTGIIGLKYMLEVGRTGTALLTSLMDHHSHYEQQQLSPRPSQLEPLASCLLAARCWALWAVWTWR